MNYPEILKEKWNELMYDERDIIEEFLKKQYDIRYGRQRDTWHFEPAIELVGAHGTLWDVRDIRLDKDKFVVFSVDTGDRLEDWECFNFAYGELSKVIEALPDADEIVKKNAIEDISRSLTENIVWTTGSKHIIGDNFDVIMVTRTEDKIEVVLRKFGTNSEYIELKNLTSTECAQLRDHINIELLHRTKEYKEVMKWLALEPNLRKSIDEYDKTNYGCVLFTLAGTDIEFDMSAIQRDDKGNLTIFGADTCCEDELITLTEKDIKEEYLEAILKWMNARRDIMDTYNGHNWVLVQKINDAWKNGGYHKLFGTILLALLYRDNMEYEQKFGEILDYSEEYAMAHAHEIMEGVCDDLDLETILSFIRYEED